MMVECPLTPALSPSEGAREKKGSRSRCSGHRSSSSNTHGSVTSMGFEPMPAANIASARA